MLTVVWYDLSMKSCSDYTPTPQPTPDKQSDRQPDKQTDNRTDRKTTRQADIRQTSRPTAKQTDRQTERQTEQHTHRRTHRAANRRTRKQAQTGRQTTIQTHPPRTARRRHCRQTQVFCLCHRRRVCDPCAAGVVNRPLSHVFLDSASDSLVPKASEKHLQIHFTYPYNKKGKRRKNSLHVSLQQKRKASVAAAPRSADNT